jgi:hypothetical protein
MADGGWRMADGGWRMADGGWRILNDTTIQNPQFTMALRK